MEHKNTIEIEEKTYNSGELLTETKNKFTILIVDDEPFILRTTSRILREANFVVYTCELWAGVASFVRRVQPDLVLLDYNMPSLRGDKICSILKKSSLNPGMKVVLFSAADESLLKRVFRECGADGYIPKRLPSSQLIEQIQAQLSERQAELNEPPVVREGPRLRTILLVDDSPLPRKMWRRFISQRYSCQIMEAENGYQAIQQLGKSSEIDLILLDINMPVMNGLQFLETIKNGDKFKHIPVIVVSTEDKENDVLRGLSLGAQGYITKPFTPNALFAVIDNVLKKQLVAMQ